MDPLVQKLAQLMQARQEYEVPPYVLLLGSSLSLTPSVRRAFAGTEDWETFWKKMQRASPTERKALLKKPLDALGLEPGYQAMTQLARAGYFNLILTLNVDDAIDNAVSPLPAKQRVLLIYDGSNAAQIVEALSRPTPRIKVAKLRGDINAQALPLTATGTFEFPEDLQRSISEWLRGDTILVGGIPYDIDVQRCIKRSTGALWYILPDGPASDNFIMRARQNRPSGEIIAGADAEFNAFFTALAERLCLREFQLANLSKPSAPAQPARLKMPKGAIDPQSAFYVERPGDRTALEAIKHQGVTITIKSPGQMGRSSLLGRTIYAAKEAGKRVVCLGFQEFDRTDADTFFRQFCTGLTEELEMEDQVDAYWKTSSGNIRRCTRYVSHYLLKELDSHLVLAMDDVDSIFNSDFRSDFFGMLRNWHNRRAREPLWKQLDLVLVTSFELYQLIDDPLLSFDVSAVVKLTDFTPGHVTDLNRRYGLPLTPDQEQQLMVLVGGHPHLVHLALCLVASQQIPAVEIFTKATDDRGPFGDHLGSRLLWLHVKKDRIEGLRQVIRRNTCEDERVFLRLQSAGLVRRERGAVLPRCQLYADYFRERLHV